MAEEEQNEIQDEDECSGLVQALQDYMELYETLREEYPGQIAIFWEAWWRTLSELLPEMMWDGENYVSHNIKDSMTAEEDQDEADDGEVSSDLCHGFGLDVDVIRSRMEFFMMAGGIALMDDIFSDSKRRSD